MFKAPKPPESSHVAPKPAGDGDETGRRSPPPEELKEEDYPLLWKSYFDEARDVPLRVGTQQEATFHILIAGPEDAESTFFMLHGAGHSAMTFALLAKFMVTHGSARVVTFDMRAHGYTTAKDESDLSWENLVDDALAVADAVFTPSTHVIVLGHSMGGSIAVRTALKASGHFKLAGIVVVDIVEGSAMAALPSMNRIIDATPPCFPDLPAAIAYGMTSGSGAQSGAAARVTIPARLRKDHNMWVWRTDLRASEPYWEGWFKGLSDDFLRVPAPKFLVLAGRDTLDTPLTIGQMQGKFQIKFLPECGHLIQEDAPEEFGQALLAYGQRYAKPLMLPPHLSSGPVLAPF